MPTLKDAHIWSNGLLYAGDHLKLSPTVSVKNGYLIDRITGARHTLHPLAEVVLTPLCLEGMTLYEWLELLVEVDIVAPQARKMLQFLSSIGILEIRRRIWDSCLLSLYRLQMRWVGYSSLTPSKRYPPTVTGLIKGCLQATYQLWIASVVVSLLLYISGFATPELLLRGGYALLLLFLSLVVHEYAHLLMLRLHGISCCVFQKPLHIAIFHPVLSPKTAAKVAISGPLAAAACCFIGSYFITTIAIACYLLALLHLINLLPWYSDGRSVLTFWHHHVSSTPPPSLPSTHTTK